MVVFFLTSQNHKDWRKHTIFDSLDTINYQNLYSNAKIIAEALARLMYGFSESDILTMHVRIFLICSHCWRLADYFPVILEYYFLLENGIRFAEVWTSLYGFPCKVCSNFVR